MIGICYVSAKFMVRYQIDALLPLFSGSKITPGEINYTNVPVACNNAKKCNL